MKENKNESDIFLPKTKNKNKNVYHIDITSKNQNISKNTSPIFLILTEKEKQNIKRGREIPATATVYIFPSVVQSYGVKLARYCISGRQSTLNSDYTENLEL